MAWALYHQIVNEGNGCQWSHPGALGHTTFENDPFSGNLLLYQSAPWSTPPPQTTATLEMRNHPQKAVSVGQGILHLQLVHTADMDKTRLSCLVRVGSVNTTAGKTRQFCLVSTQFSSVLSRLDPVSYFQVFSNPQYIWDWTGANWKLGRDKTKFIETGSRQVSPVANCVHTADTDKTRWDSFVLSVLAVWTSCYNTVSNMTIECWVTECRCA